MVLIRIDEDNVISASKIMGPGNNFLRALKIGENWRSLGLTPLYLFDEDRHGILVSTEETYYKDKLN